MQTPGKTKGGSSFFPRGEEGRKLRMIEDEKKKEGSFSARHQTYQGGKALGTVVEVTRMLAEEKSSAEEETKKTWKRGRSTNFSFRRLHEKKNQKRRRRSKQGVKRG